MFNGERYLAEAVDSLLDQTFRDFELIFSDNASTDATAAICARYADRDPRVRYYRQDRNVGASRNFNITAQLAVGEYFKWAAHDDSHTPDYLARCVAILDTDASLIACHTNVQVIDGDGHPVREHVYPPDHAGSPDAVRRFADLLREDRRCLEIFSLFRLKTLRDTRLLEPYVASDRILRAHLGLLGRFHVVQAPLFRSRDHPARSIRALPAHHLRAQWWDAANTARRTFPHWRILTEYLRLLLAFPLSAPDRRRGILALCRWCLRDLNWARLGSDVLTAFAPGSARLISPAVRRASVGRDGGGTGL